MAVAVEKDVREVLTAEREKKIRRAFNKAWDDWWENPERSKFSKWPRTRACMVFERVSARLMEEFADDRSAQFHFKDETFKLVLDDRLVARFKKADKNGMGANVTTQAVMDFCESQSDLPGLPGLQKIEVLYNLNAMQTTMDDELLVLARDGDTKLWGYNIGGNEESAEIFHIPQPPAPATPVEELVTPRRPDIFETEKAEEDAD